jgi:AraC family transcriptional activator of pyochelin receptor
MALAPPHFQALDVLDDGLTIMSRFDRDSAEDLISSADCDTVFLLVATAHGTSTPVLVVALRDQLGVLWHEKLNAILLCEASVEWIEANIAAVEPALSGGCKIATGAFYLGSEIARLTASILECPIPGRVGAFYRTAKFRELFCTAIHQYLTGELIPMTNDNLSVEDARRLIAVRRMISTRFSEKLTLRSIGRACGLNRTKLASGFRELFKCSISEALSKERLKWAAHELRLGKMSVAQIAYASGYLSHASFTRAFSKHYGIAPKQWRKRDERFELPSLSVC